MRWLPDPSEASVRQALAATVPALANAKEITLSSEADASNPEWCVSTAIVDGSFMVKFAWSEVAAIRVHREAGVLAALARVAPGLPVPRLEGSSDDPVAFVTRLAAGGPLHFNGIAAEERVSIAAQLAAFLATLHQPAVLEEMHRHVTGMVSPEPQGSTPTLRERLPRFLDTRRTHLILEWCDWVDEVLGGTAPAPVFAHGDLHGFNQIWDRSTWTLRLIVDFEVAGPADPEYDLRYFPPMEPTLALVDAIDEEYAALTGRTIDMSRVMAWHIRTALGDALWRSEAGVALPGGCTPASYVDDIEWKLRLIGAMS